MNILTLDCETTIYKYPGIISSSDRRGSSFSRYNKLVSLATKVYGNDVECFDTLEGRGKFPLHYVQTQIDNSDIIIGHNIKYDLHWLINAGIDISNIKQVWDTMLAEFLLSSQQRGHLKLRDVLIKYGKPPKLDVVEVEYWSKGIDTDEVPVNILLEYNGYDVVGTESVFLEQAKQFGVVL